MPQYGVPGAPKPLALMVGPFVGMRDTLALAAQDPQLAASVRNAYPPLPEIGMGLWSRPGFTRVAPGQRSLSGIVSYGRRTLTGTATFTTGSASVTGVGTDFLSKITPGDFIQNTAGTYSEVLSVQSDTALTLTANYPGASGGVAVPFVNVDTGGATDRFRHAANAVSVGDIVTLGGVTYAVDALISTTVASVNTTISPAGFGTGQTVIPAGATIGFLHLGRFGSTANLGITFASSLASGGAAGQYRFLDGTTRLRLVEWSPTDARAWIDRTSASMDGVALSSTSRIYSTTFANEFILSDGVNAPRRISTSWALNTIGAWGAAYGPPAVYYGKLFFIDATDRLTIRWSDENAFTGFTGTNAWTLRQTNQDQLTALIGTNDALYVFRENSITAITGAANADFKSAGTLDAISNTTGTRSPDSVCLVESAVWFLDTYGRPSKIEPGRGLVPLWADCAKTIEQVAASATNLGAAWGRYIPSLQLVVFGVRLSSGASVTEKLLVFSARTEQFVGTWDISGATDLAYGAILRDANNRPTLGVAGSSFDFALYTQKQEGDATVAVDTLAASSPAPAFVVDTGPLLGDPLTAKTVQRVVVETEDVNGGQATLKAALKGPTDSAFPTTQTMDTRDVASGMPGRALVGLEARNVRYVQVRIENDTTDSDRVVLGRIAIAGDQTTADVSVA